MDYLSLFTGAGGGDLAMQHLLGFTCKGYVEYEPYCQEVIKARIADGFLGAAPIFGDIRKFISDGYAESYRGMVDLITGGFPCQPFSVAGKRQGADDERNMWPHTIECVRQIRPRFAFLENVPGLFHSGYFGRILGDLAEGGYDMRWRVLSAAEVGAPHRRNRLWIVARCTSVGQRTGRGQQQSQGGKGTRHVANDQCPRPAQPQGRESNQRERLVNGGQDVADAERIYAQGQQNQQGQVQFGRSGIRWWDTDPADMPDSSGTKPGRGGNGECEQDERQIRLRDHGLPAQPRLGRVAHGVAHRVDRLKALGNGQVPAVAAAAWRLLTGEV